MTIHSLFFAAYRDVTGCAELQVELPARATVADLLAHLTAAVPTRRPLPPAPAVAVNQEYAALDAELHDGDVVAFIPPTSGG